MVTIVLPAHNEEKIIKDSIQSLLNQSYWDIEIIAVLDNCNDNTEKIINDNFENNLNIKVFKTVNNKNKKSGALNQLFNYYFDNMGEYILIMDADTVLNKFAIAEGVKFLNKYYSNGAVCSVAGIMKNKRNLLWYLQNIEYGLSDSSHVEAQGNIFCCRGMFSMYRKNSLQQIKNERNYIFDIRSITEDYELTLALKKYGWKISSSRKIKAYTDVPLNIKELYTQRKRWSTGGIIDLLKHKVNKYTRNDFLYLLTYLLISFLQMYLVIDLIQTKFSFNFYFLIFNIAFILINNLVRIKYIQYKNWKVYLILFTIIPQMLYFYFDMFVFFVSIKNVVFRKKINWN